MLKQDQPEEQAATVRVTPEELAAAVAALESRKQGASGTLTIGNAVEELALDAAPEDILREVEARRERGRRQTQARAGRRKWALSLASSLLCLMGLGIYSVTGSSSSIQDRMTPGTAPFNLEPRLLALDRTSRHPVISTLAEAPTDKTLYCDSYAIEVAAMSRNAQMEPQREIIQSGADMNWPVVKHGKDLYVRGWIRLPLSREAAKLADVEVFNRPDLPQLGPAPQQVSFKLDLHTSLMGLGGQRLSPDGASKFTFHGPRLTAHTYEKWQP